MTTFPPSLVRFAKQKHTKNGQQQPGESCNSSYSTIQITRCCLSFLLFSVARNFVVSIFVSPRLRSKRREIKMISAK